MESQQDTEVNIQLQYPYNDVFEYETMLTRIDLDMERENDIKTGRGFIITSPRSIKKDVKNQDGIFSSRYGNTLQDLNSFVDRYRCECGLTRGSIYHGMKCNSCGSIVKFVDDDMSIFGWIVLKEPYYVIHPNLYRSLEAFIGANRLDNILGPIIKVDKNGKEVKRTLKKDEIFAGIGLMEFKDRIDEVLDYYLGKYPAKKNYYDDIKSNMNILFTHSIPVFTTLLRPIEHDSGSLKYEKTNENYNLLNKLVYECNNDGIYIFRKRKDKLTTLYDIQFQLNAIYIELKEILSKKKGDIRSSLGKYHIAPYYSDIVCVFH